MDYKGMIAAILVRGLEQIGTSLPLDTVRNLLEVPKNAEMGDIAFPCFTLAKALRVSPPQIAQRLVAEAILPTIASEDVVEAVEAVGPYVNFVISRKKIAREVIPEIQSGAYLAPRSRNNSRIMVEYSQPNTHKAFHVGHIRCAALGDSLARLFAWNGSDVIPVNYLGDEGTHVAKCLWYLKNRYNGSIPTHDRGEFLGTLYTAANSLVDLSSYTTVPLPGILAARVVAKDPHPKNAAWTVVIVDVGGDRRQVVCGGTGFGVGDVVAYAPVGMRIAGRTVGALDKEGVRSEGMICSEREVNLSNDGQKIAVLPAGAVPGADITEVYRIPGSLDDVRSVLEVVREREREISQVLQKLESLDPEMHALWLETKEWSMHDYYEIYRWLRCRFDQYFFESECGESGKELVREYQKQGVFVVSEGAVGADLSSKGLGFCLLIKRDGTALYATRDLALARRKFDEFKVDRSIYVVDSAQTLHFQQVFACLEAMGYERARDCHHVAYAQVVRPDGKMSSRKGNVILFSELRARLLAKIRSEYLDKYQGDWSAAEISETADALALATIRYGMLNQDSNSLVVFDLDEWTSRSGNTGPYLLYAVARIHSIVREIGCSTQVPDWSLLVDPSERDLLIALMEYPSVLVRAAENYAPNIVCAFIYDLSKRFNRFYHECSVLHAEDPVLRATRLALCDSVGKTITHGLDLLGIRTVNRM